MCFCIIHVQEKFVNIEENDQEVLIEVQKLNEGWNVDNVCTILILSNSKGDIKNYVKQLIGRGVRLFKETRDFDGVKGGFADKQKEILHVTCDRKDNFRQFINEIRDELELSSESMGPEYITKEEKNSNIATREKYNDINLPIVKRIHTANEKEIFNSLTYEDLSLQEFFEEETHIKNGDRFYNVPITEIGVEADFEDEIDLKSGELEYERKEFDLKDNEIKEVIRAAIENQPVLPSMPAIKEELRNAIKELDSKEIYYKLSKSVKKSKTRNFRRKNFEMDSK